MVSELELECDLSAFKAFIAAEHARWGKFIQDAGLKPTGTDAGGSIGTPR